MKRFGQNASVSAARNSATLRAIEAQPKEVIDFNCDHEFYLTRPPEVKALDKYKGGR